MSWYVLVVYVEWIGICTVFKKLPVTDFGGQETVLLEKPDSDQDRTQTAHKKYIYTE